jgi:exopolysaccharide production repressor protein
MDTLGKAGSNQPKSGQPQQASQGEGGCSGWVNRRLCPGRVDGRLGMALPKFIIGMVFALAIVVVLSFLGGATLGTTLVRVIVCAIVIQLGYFLLVFAMVARNAPTQADKIRDAERELNSSEAAEGEKFSARRGLH